MGVISKQGRLSRDFSRFFSCFLGAEEENYVDKIMNGIVECSE